MLGVANVATLNCSIVRPGQIWFLVRFATRNITFGALKPALGPCGLWQNSFHPIQEAGNGSNTMKKVRES